MCLIYLQFMMFCAAFLKITLFFLVHKRIFFEWHDELKKPKSNRTKNEISKIVVQFNWSADVTEAFRILRILFFCALSLRDFFRWQLFFLAIKMNFWVQFNMEKIMRTTNGKKYHDDFSKNLALDANTADATRPESNFRWCAVFYYSQLNICN